MPDPTSILYQVFSKVDEPGDLNSPKAVHDERVELEMLVKSMELDTLLYSVDLRMADFMRSLES